MDFNGRRFGPAGVRRGVRVEGLGASWTPADITGVAEWWRADLGVTEAGTGVSSWVGQIAGEDLTQATDAERPTLTTRLGQDAIQFVQANGDGLAGTFATLTLAQPNSVLLVCEMVTASGTQIIVDGAALSARNVLYVNTNWIAHAGSDLNSGTASTTSPVVVVGVFNTGSSAIYVDDLTTAAATGSTSTKGLTGVTVGRAYNAGFDADVYVSEVVVVDQTITAADLSSFGSYADSRYTGLSVTY